jgi:peptidase M42 family hydrolase
MRKVLIDLLEMPSPTGFTDGVVHHVGEELERLGIEFELTRRGAIRATLPGRLGAPDRALVAHVDTLGALVKGRKENGRLRIVPIGTWSARFAEGARVTIFADAKAFRGTILPLKASGHTFGDEVDTQEVSWDNLELRIDEPVGNYEELDRLGINIGDFIAIDTRPEITDSGFINSRHLDDKAGVAALLAAAKAVKDADVLLPVDCHLLFTVSEEVGSGASAVLHGDVSEMVTIDNGVVAPGQASSEFGVTIAMGDSSGPFDYHLTRHMIHLCEHFGIPHQRDLFNLYRCDSASAVEAGNDIRTTLVTFGIDSSHGYERTHMSSLESVAKLGAAYMLTEPVFHRDREALGSLDDYPDQPVETPEVEKL